MKTEGGYLVGRIKLLSGRILNKLLSENNLNEFSGEQGKILYVLWKNDGISSSKLAEYTRLALNTLSIMLEHMEKNDLLYRTSCKDDKRKKLVYLTVHGKKLEEKTKDINTIMDSYFYKDFSEEEIIQFENQLKRIVFNLMEVKINE